VASGLIKPAFPLASVRIFPTVNAGLRQIEVSELRIRVPKQPRRFFIGRDENLGILDTLRYFEFKSAGSGFLLPYRLPCGWSGTERNANGIHMRGVRQWLDGA